MRHRNLSPRPRRGTLLHNIEMHQRYPHVVRLVNVNYREAERLGLKTHQYLLQVFKEQFGAHYRRYWIPARNGAVNPWVVRFASIDDAVKFKLIMGDQV